MDIVYKAEMPETVSHKLHASHTFLYPEECRIPHKAQTQAKYPGMISTISLNHLNPAKWMLWYKKMWDDMESLEEWKQRQNINRKLY